MCNTSCCYCLLLPHSSNYVFEYLDVEAREMQQMNLQLGFPAHVVHVIKPGSPLFNLSLQVRVLHDALHYSMCCLIVSL